MGDENKLSQHEIESLLFQDIYQQFKNIVGELSTKYKRTPTFVIKTVMENSCDFSAKFLIEHGNYNSNDRFDRYFATKHEFAKNLLIQKLIKALRDLAIKAYVETEHKNEVGIFDTVIQNSGNIIFIEHGSQSKKIIVELKTGESIDLYQITRYILECDTLFVVRLLFNQVIRITRCELENYLINSLIGLGDRAITLTQLEATKIPGNYCRTCTVSNCEFYKPARNGRTISFNSESMRRDILSAFNNMHDCLDSAVDMIIRELNYENNQK